MQSKVKTALKEGRITIGGWLTLGHTAVAEIMASAGFDWIAIDMEHSVIGIQDVQPLVQAIELGGSLPLVRLSSNDPVLAKRVMDTGASGVIVPMVNTAEEAELAVKSVKYPSWGFRSVGLARAQKYGPGFDDYASKINDEGIVILQIEHKDGVKNIDEILSVDGVDGIFIGPYDLSGSFGIPGDFGNMLMKDAERRVLDIAKKYDKPAGIHIVWPSMADFEKRKEEGFRIIAFGADIIFLGEQCRLMNRELRRFIGESKAHD